MSFVNNIDMEKVYKIGPLIILALLFGALYLPLVSLTVDGDETSLTAVEAGDTSETGDEEITFGDIRQNLLISIVLVIVVTGLTYLPNLQIYRKNNGFIGLGSALFAFLAIGEANDLIDLMELFVFLASAFGASVKVEKGLGYYSIWTSMILLLVYSALILYREFGQKDDHSDSADTIDGNTETPAK